MSSIDIVETQSHNGRFVHIRFLASETLLSLPCCTAMGIPLPSPRLDLVSAGIDSKAVLENVHDEDEADDCGQAADGDDGERARDDLLGAQRRCLHLAVDARVQLRVRAKAGPVAEVRDALAGVLAGDVRTDVDLVLAVTARFARRTFADRFVQRGITGATVQANRTGVTCADVGFAVHAGEVDGARACVADRDAGVLVARGRVQTWLGHGAWVGGEVACGTESEVGTCRRDEERAVRSRCGTVEKVSGENERSAIQKRGIVTWKLLLCSSPTLSSSKLLSW